MTSSTVLNPYAPSLSVLPNGVSLLNAPSASRNVGVFLIVRAGSRDETANTSGLAHYLEHMFFKGTARRPTTLQISREIDRLGARVAERGLTLVPTRIYFSGSRAKVEIALARGKDVHDKRETLRRRDATREIERGLREARR